MSYLTYLEDLPILDESLVREAIYCRDNHQNIFRLKDHPYQLYEATDKLREFIGSFLKFPHIVTVHSFSNTIPIHIDFGRTRAYNFIIDTGGPDVRTSFYDVNDFTRNNEGRLVESNVNYKPIESIFIRPTVWHILDVSVPHGVTNIETVRFGITVSPS